MDAMTMSEKVFKITGKISVLEKEIRKYELKEDIILQKTYNKNDKEYLKSEKELMRVRKKKASLCYMVAKYEHKCARMRCDGK